MSLVSCHQCGLLLPPSARFCARCGVARSPRPERPDSSPAAPVWVLVLFWLGTVLTLGVAVVYGAVAASPELAGQAGDQSRVRVTATIVTACAASLCLGQLGATIGLSLGRHWARPLATLVCVVWCLSCVGLPLGLLALNAIWRPGRPPAGALPGDGA